MVVRIRLNWRAAVRRNRAVLAASSAFLTPAAVMACVLALWRLAADLRLTGEFAISEGPFSRWQVWLAVAVVLQYLASRLSRMDHGRGEEHGERKV